MSFLDFARDLSAEIHAGFADADFNAFRGGVYRAGLAPGEFICPEPDPEDPEWTPPPGCVPAPTPHACDGYVHLGVVSNGDMMQATAGMATVTILLSTLQVTPEPGGTLTVGGQTFALDSIVNDDGTRRTFAAMAVSDG